MKKTLLPFIFSFLIFGVGMAQKPSPENALIQKNQKKIDQSINSINYGVQLTDFLSGPTFEKDQNRINSGKLDAFISQFGNPYNRQDQSVGEKCWTVENMQNIREKYPNMETIDEFESWMQRKLEERRSILSILPGSGPVAIDGSEIIIPYVVHIIHDGTEVNTPGNIVGTNLSAAQVESQIRVLNEDFNMENADRANSPWWDDRAAAIGIRFAPVLYNPETGIPLEEPGIDRVDRNEAGFTAPPFDPNYVEAVVKPTTSWDWESTLNIWVLELPSGLYGYAQFPSSSGLDGMPSDGGPSTTDGVAIAPFTFGSTADDDGSFTTTSNEYGRTTTHELGHWVGLRHVWGDGNCDADDFVEDTPPQNGSSPFGSCVSGQNTCNDLNYGYTEDLNDMKENFMDYSADACMNLFTLDQLERADVVFDNSPGRDVLTDSDADDMGAPIVFFTESSVDFSDLEAIGCELYTDYDLNIRVAFDYTGTSEIKVNLNVAGGTAVQGEDFDIMGDPFVTFSGGQDQTESITIRFYNDAVTEGAETIEFSLALDAGDTNVTLTDNADYNATTWTINDSENGADLPVVSFEDIDLEEPSECFESGDVTFNIDFDDWASETSWELQDNTGMVVESGGPYANGDSGINLTFSLPDGSYTFIMMDSFGDGNDGYTLTASNGDVIVNSTGAFTNTETTNFCLGDPVFIQPIQIGIDALLPETANCGDAYTDYFINMMIDNCALGESDVAVKIVVDGGDAVEGEDYEFTGGVDFTFDGSGPETIAVPIRIFGDSMIEDNETFTFHVAIVDENLATTEMASSTITIIDSDSPVIQASGTSFTTPEGKYACEGNEMLEIELSLTGCSLSTSPTVVSVSANSSSTATDGADYTILTPEVTLDPSTGESGVISIEFINDFVPEGMETLILDLSITSGEGNLMSDMLTVDITDALGHVSPSVIAGIYADFEDGMLPEGWVMVRNVDSDNDFTISENPNLDGMSLHISNDSEGTKAYEYSNSNPLNALVVMSPPFSLSSSAPLDFMYRVLGEAGFFGVYDTGDVGIVSADADVTDFTSVAENFVPNNFIYLLFRPNGSTMHTEVPGYDLAEDLDYAFPGKKVRLAFVWVSDQSVVNNPPLAIDNVTLDGVYQGNAIETFKMLGEGVPSFPINADEETFYYNPTNENIAMAITSSSDHDCSQAVVRTSGTGVTPLISEIPGEEAAEKTFEVTAGKPDLKASLTTGLYYTEDEIAGWEEETGKSRDELYMFKLYDYTLETCIPESVTLELTPDLFPGETTWDIVNVATGDVVANGQADGSVPTTTTEIPLPDGDYRFTIYDSQGDGICCTWGTGSYTLIGGDGAEIISGGAFGRSESANFCITNSEKIDLCNDYSNIDFAKVNLIPYGNGYKVVADFATGLADKTTFGISALPSTTPTVLTAEQYQETVKLTFENKYDEGNIAYYIFEERNDRSLDFEELETVNQTGSNTYTITDYHPNNGLNEYRVAMVLKDGSIDYACKTVFVNYVPTEKFKVTPNPTVDQLTMVISDPLIKGELNIGVFDALGRQVMAQDIIVLTGVTRYTIDVSNLASGQYYLKVVSDSGYERSESFTKTSK